MLQICLFISLFIALFLLLVPINQYDISPGTAAVDAVKKQFSARIIQKEKILKILGRNIQDIVKTGLLTGVGLALLLFLLTVKILGIFSILLAMGGLVIGIILAEKLIDKEYKKWQTKLLEGIPTLVNFMPAFLTVESITPREALGHTLPFLPEPLKSEMWVVLNKIKRTGNVQEAFETLAARANHPLVQAIAFRISAAWDTKVTSDLFTDLSDQVEEMNEMAATRATTAKKGYIALVCVIGLFGGILEGVYPGVRYLFDTMSRGFGF